MTTDTTRRPIPSASFAPGTSPGLFAFDGGTAIWERYDVQATAWVKSPAGPDDNLPGNTAAGAAMVYDGNGYANGFVYAFQGGTNAFCATSSATATTGAWDERGQCARGTSAPAAH
jgi:hypothetical protein